MVRMDLIEFLEAKSQPPSSSVCSDQTLDFILSFLETESLRENWFWHILIYVHLLYPSLTPPPYRVLFPPIRLSLPPPIK